MWKEKWIRQGESLDVLWISVWWKKWVQMVLNHLFHTRYDHEIIVQSLTKLLEIQKWDDTNFISFESYLLKKVQTIRSQETRLSYQMLWKKYLEKKSSHKIWKNVAAFSDSITAALETSWDFASASFEGRWWTRAHSVSW